MQTAATKLAAERDARKHTTSRVVQATAQKHAASAELLQTRSMLVQAQQHVMLLPAQQRQDQAQRLSK